MFFVAPCPACGKKLRFPLDRGKIRVSCTCGHSFIADPDDPLLYKKGSFDLKETRRKESLYTRIYSAWGNFSLSSVTEGFIRHFIDFKYKIQNYRLLPGREQKVLLIRGVIIILVIIFLLYLLFFSPASVPVDSQII